MRPFPPPPPRATTLEDIAKMLRELTDEVRQQAKSEEEFRRTLILLANQSGDLTHATVQTAARIKRVGVITIKRRIKSGEYTLEVIPGKRTSGIPMEQLFAAWVPIRVARRAYEREKLERQQRDGQKV
ncbi:MAG: hypothetical protein ACSLFQ_10055 [Thermoanaerobaculia bacterium]